jgi:hypothetical protein
MEQFADLAKPGQLKWKATACGSATVRKVSAVTNPNRGTVAFDPRSWP